MDHTVHGILQDGVGRPFPSLGDLPNPGAEPRSPTLQADSLPVELPGKPSVLKVVYVFHLTPQHYEEILGCPKSLSGHQKNPSKLFRSTQYYLLLSL